MRCKCRHISYTCFHSNLSFSSGGLCWNLQEKFKNGFRQLFRRCPCNALCGKQKENKFVMYTRADAVTSRQVISHATARHDIVVTPTARAGRGRRQRNHTVDSSLWITCHPVRPPFSHVTADSPVRHMALYRCVLIDYHNSYDCKSCCVEKTQSAVVRAASTEGTRQRNCRTHNAEIKQREPSSTLGRK